MEEGGISMNGRNDTAVSVLLAAVLALHTLSSLLYRVYVDHACASTEAPSSLETATPIALHYELRCLLHKDYRYLY